MKKQVKKDTNWIYGLKLLAAFCVVIHHYALYFFPAFIDGNSNLVRTSNAIELKFVNMPFNIFSWGGNVCVAIFFIISGFLIYYKSYYNKVDIKESTIKRYFRLALPMLFMTLIYIFVVLILSIKKDALLCSEVYGKIGGYCGYKFSIFKALYESMIGFFANGNTEINPVLWTMKGELIGSFVILCYSEIFKKDKNKTLIYIISILLLHQTVIFPFLLGMILCNIYLNNKYDNLLKNPIIKIILIILSLYFCGFTYQTYGTKLYKFLSIKLSDALLFYHTIGSFLLILTIIKSNILKKILSYPIYKKYANLSFSIYLFHWLILNTFSMTMMNLLLRRLNYKYSFILMFITSFIVILIISHFFGEIVMKYTKITTEKIYDRFFFKEQRGRK